MKNRLKPLLTASLGLDHVDQVDHVNQVNQTKWENPVKSGAPLGRVCPYIRADRPSRQGGRTEGKTKSKPATWFEPTRPSEPDQVKP